MLHNGHFVLCQRSGFVGTDHLRAAERFHRRQLPDDGVSFGHVGNADGEYNRHDGGESLRNRRDGKADRDHKGVQHDLTAKIARFNQAERKDENTDADHQTAQDFAELIQLDLERGNVVLRVCERVGDLSHFGIHAGRNDHRFSAAVNDGAAHVRHIFTVAKRHFLLFLQRQRPDDLVDRH